MQQEANLSIYKVRGRPFYTGLRYELDLSIQLQRYEADVSIEDRGKRQMYVFRIGTRGGPLNSGQR